MSTMFVDLPALAKSLEQVPLHQRLYLEAELIQVASEMARKSIQHHDLFPLENRTRCAGLMTLENGDSHRDEKFYGKTK